MTLTVQVSVTKMIITIAVGDETIVIEIPIIPASRCYLPR